MGITSELKKEGITYCTRLDTLTVNKIANSISEKLVSNFPNLGLNKKELFASLARLNMYFTKMPGGLAKAKYYYKNSSIYFDESLDIENIDTFAMHECIHYIQEVKDKNRNLIRLGLCDFGELKIYGMALNEAATQLATAKALNTPMETVKYFDITLNTNSPSYYPLECTLVNQLAYLIGDYVFFHSTFFGSDLFKDKFSNITSEKTYYDVQNSLDKIMYLEDKIAETTAKIENPLTNDKKTIRLQKKLQLQKQEIKNIFINTQNLIFTKYFDSSFEKIQNLEELEDFRRKLYHLKDFLAFTDDYTFFDDYYLTMMSKLEVKYNLLEGNPEHSLTIVKESKLAKFFKKIYHILFKTNSEYIKK